MNPEAVRRRFRGRCCLERLGSNAHRRGRSLLERLLRERCGSEGPESTGGTFGRGITCRGRARSRSRAAWPSTRQRLHRDGASSRPLVFVSGPKRSAAGGSPGRKDDLPFRDRRRRGDRVHRRIHGPAYPRPRGDPGRRRVRDWRCPTFDRARARHPVGTAFAGGLSGAPDARCSGIAFPDSADRDSVHTGCFVMCDCFAEDAPLPEAFRRAGPITMTWSTAIAALECVKGGQRRIGTTL